MAKRKHLKLLSDKQLEEVSKIKFKYGVFGKEEDDEEDNTPPNYYRQASNLRVSIENFTIDQEQKYARKNRSLEIPADVDYIQVNFVSQFVISKYFNDYYKKFGLEAINFFNFGKSGLFAVVNRDLFQIYLNEINSFIQFGLNINPDSKYDNYVTYVNSFKLLTAKDIIRFKVDEIGNVVYLSLVELPLASQLQYALIESLIAFLKSNSISHYFDKTVNRIELFDVSFEQVQLIAENFDVIQNVTCSLSSIVRPSDFNFVKREYGFNISNAADDLPLIGIIDTGISMDTPLKSITIQDDSFSLQGNPLIDISGTKREGHGTAVAALAALGRINHLNKFQGEVRADAKLLSIKLFESGKGYLSETQVVKMLYDAKSKYPSMKLFVLTICYDKFKAKNEPFSSYTYELDKFAHSTDSLIFICTANNINAVNENTDYDLAYFGSVHTNLSTPADSLNNVTVGAAAENLNNGPFYGISSGREFPTLYSRKGHIDLAAVFPRNKSNKNYFKPDVIECGGDLGFYNPTTIDYIDNSAMAVLSARPELGYILETGTSLSAPLTANLAAKILNEYPNINAQTIKALIINGASLNNIQFPKQVSHLLNVTAGNGFVDVENSLFSNENKATLILEDVISDTDLKIYPIYFPKYLLEDDLGRKKGLVKITATLCFSFEPLQNNQLSYNPIHMAFSFFKNHSADEINAKNDDFNSKLRSTLSWSQNGRNVSKPIPFSNSQKINFTIDLNHLISENQVLKLAIHCKVSTQIIGGLPASYPKQFPFSMAISIEENTKKKSGKLYDELLQINNLEVLGDIELEGSIDL
ncbi:MAG: Subtilase family protein [Bacteroidetes bacterium ADurb.Bin174]|nr:MAG: Subtilase family protein [Bacteroidetes bacterium ADurb.Bin174]